MTPEQQAFAGQLAATFTHPLRHLVCPECSVRFGIESTELRFVEQTEATLWCPRGHRLKAKSKSNAPE
jgi:hypothetical protein